MYNFCIVFVFNFSVSIFYFVHDGIGQTEIIADYFESFPSKVPYITLNTNKAFLYTFTSVYFDYYQPGKCDVHNFHHFEITEESNNLLFI